MAKTIKDVYQRLATNRFITRSPIRAIDWKNLHHTQNFLYSRFAERITGITYDPNFALERVDTYQLGSTTVTKGMGTNQLLSNWQPIFRPWRYGIDGNVYLSIQVFGGNVDLRFEVINLAKSLIISTDTVICPTPGWHETDVIVALEDAVNPDTGEPYPLMVRCTGARNVDSSGGPYGEGLGYIYQIEVFNRYLVSNELPERDYKIEWGGPITFTTAGATGRIGPNQAQIDAEYSGTLLDGQVISSGDGLQVWTAPFTGRYSFTVAGAVGGAGTGANIGGRGAIANFEFDISGGETLTIAVGQRGAESSVMASGGGSSSIQLSTMLLAVAGGGGGHRIGSDGNKQQTCDATSLQTGKTAFGNTSAGTGGTSGNGGNGATSRAAGGGGYLTGGQGITGGGAAIVAANGPVGGDGSILYGGFGGGGAIIQSTGWGAAAGGGGYSGGGGAYASSGGSAAGGGGGSYVDANALNRSIGVGVGGNTGDGYVTIDLLD